MLLIICLSIMYVQAPTCVGYVSSATYDCCFYTCQFRQEKSKLGSGFHFDKTAWLLVF